MNGDSPRFLISATGAAALLLAAIVGGLLYGCPQYHVYSQRMDGEAELAQANYSKQVQVQDALAKRKARSRLPTLKSSAHAASPKPTRSSAIR